MFWQSNLKSESFTQALNKHHRKYNFRAIFQYFKLRNLRMVQATKLTSWQLNLFCISPNTLSLSCAVLVCMFSMFIIGIYVNPETGTRQSGVSGVGIWSNIANILIILPKVTNIFLILPPNSKQPFLLQISSLMYPNNHVCYKYFPYFI